MADDNDHLKVTILGCGSSPGVPRVNGDWGNCDPENSKNRRTRASILVERIAQNGGKTTVVIDTGPDFRAQMLMAGVTDIDAVVYTHAHADHIHGIDDVRTYVLGRGTMMPAYADSETQDRLQEAFGYCFRTPPGSDYPPIIQLQTIEPERPFDVDGQGGTLTFLPLLQEHGKIHSLAFRIADFAYCTDVSEFPPNTLEKLDNLDVLIIDCLQYREHPSHLSLAQSLDAIATLEPRKAYLTHMHTPLDYETVCRETPDNVWPCYDGMEIVLP